MPIWLAVALGLLPLVLLVVVLGVRLPMAVLSVYAAVLPFGSMIRFPVGLPRPFDTLSTLVGAVAALAIVAHLLVTRHRAPVIVSAWPFWVAFLGVATLTTAWSVAQWLTLLEVVILISVIALYALAVLLRVTWADVRRIEVAAVGGAALTGLYAVYLYTTGALTTTAEGTPRFMTTGGEGDGNITAATLLLPLAIALQRGLEPGRRRRWPYLATVLLVLVAIALTGSRGGLLGVAAVVIVLGFNNPKRKALPLYFGGLLLAATMVLAIAPPRVLSDSSSGRTEMWRLAARACASYCDVGAGWATFPVVHEEVLLATPDGRGRSLRFKAHNIWIRTGVEAGWVGVVLLAAGFVMVLRDLRRLPRMRRGPPLAAVTGLIVTNMFLSNLEFKYFWLVLMYAGWCVLAEAERTDTLQETDGGEPRATTPRVDERILSGFEGR
jgi:hypothetical protein